MKKQKLWTRLAAGLGVAVLVLCQNGIIPVRAAEVYSCMGSFDDLAIEAYERHS